MKENILKGSLRFLLTTSLLIDAVEATDILLRLTDTFSEHGTIVQQKKSRKQVSTSSFTAPKRKKVVKKVSTPSKDSSAPPLSTVTEDEDETVERRAQREVEGILHNLEETHAQQQEAFQEEVARREMERDEEEEEDWEEMVQNMEEEAEEKVPSVGEKILTVGEVLGHFASTTILLQFVRLLQRAPSLPAAVPPMIVSFLQRFIDQTSYEPMLYQMTILRIFQQILADREMARKNQFRGLLTFVRRVVRHFFEACRNNDLLVCWVWAWKKKSDCTQFQPGYVRPRSQGSQWSPEEDSLLRHLWATHSQDPLRWTVIAAGMPPPKQHRRLIWKRLQYLGLIDRSLPRPEDSEEEREREEQEREEEEREAREREDREAEERETREREDREAEERVEMEREERERETRRETTPRRVRFDFFPSVERETEDDDTQKENTPPPPPSSSSSSSLSPSVQTKRRLKGTDGPTGKRRKVDEDLDPLLEL